MPTASIGGVNIHYEVTGRGIPLVWAHEFGGDHESWDLQVRFFSRGYQVITYNARGYPPSDVPTDPEAYSQEQAVEDLHGLLNHLGIEQAYIGGLSMGGTMTLSFGIAHPEMAKGLIVAGAGTGSTDPQRMAREAEQFATKIEREGMEPWGAAYAEGPTRVQFRRKDPKGWEQFRRGVMGHSATGSALTFRGVQGRRPSIYALEPALRKLQVPTLIVIGDEDDPCVEPAIFMKRTIARSGLVVVPQTGHTVNLEEPDLFNRVVLDFMLAVEADRWGEREPTSGVGFLAHAEAQGSGR